MNQPYYYETLFTWFLSRDLTNDHPRLLPMTEEKQDISNASKESWQLFFEDNIHRFDGVGFPCGECYRCYHYYCKDIKNSMTPESDYTTNINKF